MEDPAILRHVHVSPRGRKIGRAPCLYQLRVLLPTRVQLHRLHACTHDRGLRQRRCKRKAVRLAHFVPLVVLYWAVNWALYAVDDSAQGSYSHGIRLPNGRNDSPGPMPLVASLVTPSPLCQLGRRTQMDEGSQAPAKTPAR
jgi:hypothetical protein